PRGGPHTPGRHAGRLAGGSGTATRVARHPLRRARAAVTDLFDATPHEALSTAAPAPPAPLADRMRPRALDEVLGQGHLLGAGKVLRSAIETGELHSMILWGPPGSGKTTLARLMAHTTGARFIAFSAVLAGVKEIREVVVEAARALDEDDLVAITRRALGDAERGLAGLAPEVDDDALRLIARLANGDARAALNVLELAVQLVPAAGGRRRVTEASIREAAQKK